MKKRLPANIFAPKDHAAAGILQDIFEINALYHLGNHEHFKKLVQEYIEKYPNGIAHVAIILDKLLQDPVARSKFKESLDAATLILEN